MLVIRPIQTHDDPAVASLIRTVMPEFGASGPGFAILDPEVDHMSVAYRRPGAAYFVVCDGDRVVGGGGVAPLDGGRADTCELRKMYFLVEARGRGAGRQLMAECLDAARALGYERCYLETLGNMEAAGRLYEKTGFTRLSAQEGATGHFGCNRYYALDLRRVASTPSTASTAKSGSSDT
jgi:putative acetyltransferase